MGADDGRAEGDYEKGREDEAAARDGRFQRESVADETRTTR
jgi:hypothetical protein